MAFSFISCGNNTDVSYGGHSYDDYKSTLENTAQYLSQIDEAGAEAALASSSDDISSGVMQDWKECRPLVGEFKSCKEFTLEKTGKTLTATLICDYSKKDVKLVYVFDLINDEITLKAINVEPVYTLGETMKKAGLNTVMGIGIVFVMLVLMSLLISCFKFISKAEKSNKETDDAPVSGDTNIVSSGASDDLELVAVITAAIAASSGQATDSFVVRSIKRR